MYRCRGPCCVLRLPRGRLRRRAHEACKRIAACIGTIDGARTLELCAAPSANARQTSADLAGVAATGCCLHNWPSPPVAMHSPPPCSLLTSSPSSSPSCGSGLQRCNARPALRARPARARVDPPAAITPAALAAAAAVTGAAALVLPWAAAQTVGPRARPRLPPRMPARTHARACARTQKPRRCKTCCGVGYTLCSSCHARGKVRVWGQRRLHVRAHSEHDACLDSKQC